jgi:predicted acyl esterase
MAVRRLHALAASVALIALAATIQAAPAAASWQPEPERYGVGKHQNVPVTMSDGTVLRADVYFPTDTRTGARDRAVPRDPHPDAVRQGLELDQLSRR